MLEEAKTSGIQEDSLMLGIQFGMTQDSFFSYCQKYNQNGEIFDSGSPLQAARKINWNGNNFQMNFYPNYKSDKIHKLEFECFHEGYSQWNKQYYSESILEDIKTYFEKEFQLRMESFDHEKFGKAYVAFTGNRRLRIFIKNQKMIGGEFLDMTDQFKK